MVLVCAICNNKFQAGSSTSFHKFPTDVAARNEWCRNLKLNVDSISNSDRICSSHFAAHSFSSSGKRKRLLTGALPVPVQSTSNREIESPNKRPETGSPIHPRTETIKRVRFDFNQESPSTSSFDSPSSMKGSSSTISCSETERELKKLKRHRLLSNRKTRPVNNSRVMLERKLGRAKNLILQQRLKIRKLQRNNNILNNKLTSLQKSINYLKENNFLSRSAETIIDGNLPPSAAAVLKRASKGVSREKYPPELRSFALTLSFYSAKAYEYVREKFSNSLPHPSTLSRWYQSVDGSPGFTEQALAVLRKKVLELTDTNQSVLCNLLVDEMAIMKRVEWTGKKFTGFVDIGSSSKSDRVPEAKNALVFMLVAINSHWKIPVGYFLVDSLTGHERAIIVKRLLSFLNETGVIVTSLTFDGAATNVSMVQSLGVDLEDAHSLKTYFEHPESKDPVYIFFDPPHMLKLWRNCLADAGPLTDMQGRSVDWKYISRLVELQNEEGLHAATKIRNRHIKFRNEVQKVKIAAQTFSNSVADALNFLEYDLKLDKFQGAAPVAEFCRVANNLFDIFNVRTMFSKNQYSKALKVGSSQAIFNYLEYCEKYILHLQLKGISVLLSKRKMGFLGFLVCIESLKCFYSQYIGNSYPMLNYLLTYKLSQDHLEVFFSAVRGYGGCNNNPTAKQFEAIYKRLLTHIETKGNKFGNTVALDATSILNVSSVTKSNLNENLEESTEFQNMLESFDQTYLQLFTCLTLSEFSEDIVAYIAGFVVKCLKKCVSCTDCLNLLEQQDPISLLQKRKAFGKLINASDFVINICKSSEKYFRTFLIRENLFDKKFIDISVFLITGSLRNLSESVFTTALTHSNDFFSDHPLQIVKLIIKNYFKLRIHHETFKIKDTKENRIRNVLTKSILFKNQ